MATYGWGRCDAALTGILRCNGHRNQLTYEMEEPSSGAVQCHKTATD